MTPRRLYSSLFVLISVSSCLPLAAQDSSASPGLWAGAWGTVKQVPPQAGNYQGERLQISDCEGNACTMELAVESAAGHCDTTGGAHLAIESSTRATAHLGGDKCIIAMTLSGSGETAAITTKAQSAGCSDYCTAGVTLDHTFPLRARTQYFGDSIDACFLGTSNARMAICNDAALAGQERQWMSLSLKVSDLEDKHFSMMDEREKFVGQCDSNLQAAACLSAAFDKAVADLQTRQAAWTRSVTEPGDPAEASAKAAVIAGRYRHSFTSGDVQGDTFKAVDKLKISMVSRSSIAYSLNLNFYNGHTCSKSGTASYRQSGIFVDQVQDKPGELCVFEIVPTSKGVELRDPTGICRTSDCGMRGGYNGAGFTFAEKLKAPAHPAAPKR